MVDGPADVARFDFQAGHSAKIENRLGLPGHFCHHTPAHVGLPKCLIARLLRVGLGEILPRIRIAVRSHELEQILVCTHLKDKPMGR